MKVSRDNASENWGVVIPIRREETSASEYGKYSKPHRYYRVTLPNGQTWMKRLSFRPRIVVVTIHEGNLYGIGEWAGSRRKAEKFKRNLLIRARVSPKIWEEFPSGPPQDVIFVSEIEDLGDLPPRSYRRG